VVLLHLQQDHLRSSSNINIQHSTTTTTSTSATATLWSLSQQQPQQHFECSAVEQHNPLQELAVEATAAKAAVSGNIATAAAT